MKTAIPKKTRHEIIDRSIVKPFKAFFKTEKSSGLILLGCTVVALIIANSLLSNYYYEFWETEFTLIIGDFTVTQDLHYFINDGLMAIFFFVVSLEIKRELIVGELNSFQKASLPLLAALGGMIVPALIFLGFNLLIPVCLVGWGIPIATDIAFVVGILALLGNKAPLPLKVFVTSLAIADDIGSIIIIGLFYCKSINWIALLIVLLLFLLLSGCNQFNINNPQVYLVLGILLWVFLLQSGIHATIAGVLLAITVPTKTIINPEEFLLEGQVLLHEFKNQGEYTSKIIMLNNKQQNAIKALENACLRVESPLQRFERVLHYWVAFFIVPLFIISNAGVTISSITTIFHPLFWGIFFGLVVGKPIGILLFSWIGLKLGIASLPKGLNWQHLAGGGCLGGMGFTMSLFITSLALTDPTLISIAKFSILLASLISGIIGFIILVRLEAPAKKIKEYKIESDSKI